ncbi:unnamed protein product, partial [Amoebophrya sp. A25]|eukprot:GSA25T00014397001.1
MASTEFKFSFPHWVDGEADTFSDRELNREIENCCWKDDQWGHWTLSCERWSLAPSRKVTDEVLQYILKYIFVKKLRVCKRYPRTFSEFEDLRRQSHFFGTHVSEHCWP